MDVARSHRPGHIGNTPQDTDTIVAGGRVVGMLADFSDHLEPAPRVDATLPRPDVSESPTPGYFRDDSTALAITGAVARMQPNVMRRLPTAKTLGGYDPLGDA